MSLKAPNPSLATQSVTVNGRTLQDDTSGGPKFVSGATATYPAIVTMQVKSTEALKHQVGTVVAITLWNILLFSADDPGVTPQFSKMTVNVQGRTLIAETKSSRRDTGCWYVLGKTYD